MNLEYWLELLHEISIAIVLCIFLWLAIRILL